MRVVMMGSGLQRDRGRHKALRNCSPLHFLVQLSLSTYSTARLKKKEVFWFCGITMRPAVRTSNDNPLQQINRGRPQIPPPPKSFDGLPAKDAL